ncbi:MAG: TadE family protein [Pseudonocardiaceae bacterium]
MGRTRGAGPRDGGAAAVEFALVVPVLLLVLFGIIDFGLLFSNQLSVKQGVREGARQGIVANYGSACSMTWSVPPSDNLKKLGCTTVDRTSAVGGSSYVKVKVPDGWVKGKSLVVCQMVQTNGLTGLVPMPDGGVVLSKVEMSIEKAEPGQTETGGEQAPPIGHDWSWC